MNRPIITPLRLNPELPAKLEDVINKALEKDRELRYHSAADICTDLKRLRRDTDSGRMLASGSGVAQQVATEAASGSHAAVSVRPASSLGNKRYVFAVVSAGLLAVAFAAYHFGVGSKSSSEPAKVSRISHWNKPMTGVILSPDGHTIAFASPAGGVNQIFVMLTSGGEPLQLTNDSADKGVNSFSLDSTQVYYTTLTGSGTVWNVPTLGGTPTRVVSGVNLITSPADGSFFYIKPETSAIFRRPKSGVGEELVWNMGSQGIVPWGILAFPDGKDLLSTTGPTSNTLSTPPTTTLYKVNVASHDAQKLGEISGSPTAFVWKEPGKSLLFSRTVNDVTNIWEYNLTVGALKQVTFGAGPDLSPMLEPSGKGIYFVTGREAGALTIYKTRTKQSFDLVSDNATQPLLSRNGSQVNYITLAGNERQELWISDIDGKNKAKLYSSASLITLAWSPDGSQLAFSDVAGGTSKLYLMKNDGSGLQQVPWVGASLGWAAWSPDVKTLYFSGYEKDPAKIQIWKTSSESATVEKVAESCGYVQDVSADGRYLLSGYAPGGGIGIYEFSLSESKCTPLLPDVATLEIHFAADGKSFLYLNASRGETVIYRQPWHDGKLAGPAQPDMKLPFAFQQGYAGNAYDFSNDLSTIVYARPGGQADLYLVSHR